MEFRAKELVPGLPMREVHKWDWLVESKDADTSWLPDDTTFVPVDSQPKVKYQPPPNYPDDARLSGIKGSVWVSVLVDQAGRSRRVKVLKPSGKKCGFEESSLACAAQTTWEPALLAGKPVAVWISYEVKFNLKTSMD